MKAFLGGSMAAITRDGQKWTQDQIDEIERAKEQQRRRDLEWDLQRQANSQNRQPENVQ
jgi:hypothetical protein